MPNARSPKGGLVTLLLGVGTVFGAVTPVRAQEAPAAHQIRWYEVTIALAGVSAFFLVDNPVRSYMLDNQTTGKNNAADMFRSVGQPEVWALVPAVMIGTGLVIKKPGLTHSGLRAVTSAALAGGITSVLKFALGRERPNVEGSEPLDFEPFESVGDDASMPSGHTASAFGFAASLAEDVHPLWAKIGLYTLATGTAWSRVYDNKHWTSDVVFGALVGITSAKIVRGDWLAWGIRMPTVFTDGHQVTVSWQGTF
jgi:membrane-associated phospholipid phosphatase